MSLPIRPAQFALHFVLAAAALTLAAGTSAAQCPVVPFKLLASDGAPNEFFGTSVAISGTTAIVGVVRDDDNGPGSGSAYLFDITTGLQIAKLLPSDGTAGDRFGESIGISGTTAIVGASWNDDNGANSGSAYLFDITTGLQIAKLLPSDGAPNELFGDSVAISGTTAIVGASHDDDNGFASGSAYLFDITTGLQIAKLLASDGGSLDEFGTSVAINGGTAIVGAMWDADNGANSGSAYLFDITTGLQIAKLLSSDVAVSDFFGGSVAISDTTAIVGALGNDDNGQQSGSAYLFDITTGLQIAKLLPSNGAALDRYGYSVAISGTTAIVGAIGDDDNGLQSGSAYAFCVFSGFADFCSGDGGDQMGCTNCPCGNNAVPGTTGGCLNSVARSARLWATGDTSVSLPPGSTDDLRFSLTDAPGGSFCILNSGDAVAPGNPMNPCFGMESGLRSLSYDGFRCVVANERRHGGRPADSNGAVGFTNNPWGGEAGPNKGIAQVGSGYVSGQTRYFAVVYRDNVALSCMRGLNTSQAVEAVFTP